MVIVKNVTTSKETHCTRIKFDYTVEYDNDSSVEIDDWYSPEIYSYVIQTMCPRPVYLFQLFSVKVPVSMVNRITDYKGVWGLLKMGEKGRSFSVIRNDFKIYYGLCEVERVRFSRYSTTAVFLYSPAEISILEESLPLLLLGEKEKGVTQFISAVSSIRVLDYERGSDAITITIWDNNGGKEKGEKT